MIADVPIALFADHTALAFSPDGTRITAVSGKEAVAWDIEEKRRIDSWTMNPGLVNCPAVGRDGEILVARVETEDGDVYPLGNAHPQSHPRRCRVWRLLPGGKRDLVCEVKDFSLHVKEMFLSPDGDHLVIRGLGAQSTRGAGDDIASYDARTGRRIWAPTPHAPLQLGIAALDPTGQFLAYQADSLDKVLALLKMPNGTLHSSTREPFVGLGPGARLAYFIPSGDNRRDGVEIRRLSEELPFLVLEKGVSIQYLSAGFDRSGQHFHWGLDDGPARVADLTELRKQLTQIGLAW
jgi:hypothetical protein